MSKLKHLSVALLLALVDFGALAFVLYSMTNLLNDGALRAFGALGGATLFSVIMIYAVQRARSPRQELIIYLKGLLIASPLLYWVSTTIGWPYGLLPLIMLFQVWIKDRREDHESTAT